MARDLFADAGFSGGGSGSAPVFDRSIGFIMNDLEGGDKIVPDGKGRARWGINTAANPDVDIDNMTEDDAKNLYRDRYWSQIEGHDLTPEAQAVAFDAAINHRGGFANDIIQQSGGDPQKMMELRRQEYQRLAQSDPAQYGGQLQGWNSRLDKLNGFLPQLSGDGGGRDLFAEAGIEPDLQNGASSQVEGRDLFADAGIKIDDKPESKGFNILASMDKIQEIQNKPAEKVKEIDPETRNILQRYVTDPVARGTNEAQKGFGMIALNTGAMPEEEALSGIVINEMQRRGYPVPKDIQQFQQELMSSPTVMSAVKKFFSDSRSIPIALESVGSSIPSILGGLGGLGIGALAAPWTGGASLVVGPAIGTGLGSGATEYGTTITGMLEDRGVDMTDREAVRKMVHDKDFMDQAKARGLTRGAIIGTLDAVTAGTAGRIAGPVAKPIERMAGKTLGHIAGGTAEMAAQALGGAGGETLGQLATDKKITSPADIALEAAVEMGTGGPEIASNVIGDKVKEKLTKTPQVVESGRDLFAEAEIAPPAPSIKPLKETAKTELDDTNVAESPAPVVAQKADTKNLVSDKTPNVIDKPVSEQPGIHKVVTPRGDQEIETSFDVVDVRDLISSDKENFPQALQPRDRSRKSSDLQINDIANTLDPHRLAENRTTDSGAPIVGMDNVVESGNGRTMGIRKAYEQNLESAKDYKDYIAARGYDVSKIEQPVLIQRRRTEMSPEDRIRFTIASNERTGAAMSTTERAMADAKTVTPDMAALYEEGDITDPRNRTFVKSFIDKAVAPADRGSMVGPDGALSQDGVRRIRGALLASAYDDSDVVQSLTEDTDTEIKSIGNAMTSIAGKVASFRAAVNKGEAPAALDITKNLVQAAKIIRDARAGGKSMDQVLGQKAMFAEQDIEPITESVIRAMYQPNLKRPVSMQKIEKFLRKYYDEAAKAEAGPNMLGLDDVTPEEILDLAQKAIAHDPEPEQGGLNLAPAPKPDDEVDKIKAVGEKIKKTIKGEEPEPKPAKAKEKPIEEPKPKKRRAGGGGEASVIPDISEPEEISPGEQTFKNLASTEESILTDQLQTSLSKIGVDTEKFKKKRSAGPGGEIDVLQYGSLKDILPKKSTEVYHQTSLPNARNLSRRLLSGTKRQDFYVSPDIDLALGQKGASVTLVMDPAKLHGRMSLNKPGAAMSPGSEYKVGLSGPKNLKAIIVKNSKTLEALKKAKYLANKFDFDNPSKVEQGLRIDRIETEAKTKAAPPAASAMPEPAVPEGSKDFKEWFGDSKVVDKEGEPLAVYHGSKAKDFGKFTINNAAPAAWFAGSEKDAGVFGPNVSEHFIKIENPYTLENEGLHHEMLYDPAEIKELIDAGHDGVIVKQGKTTNYAVFSADHIMAAAEKEEPAIEAREKSGGAGEANAPKADKSIRLPPVDFEKVFKIPRESMSELIWRDQGHDPQTIARYSEKKRFEVAKKALKDKFGIDVFVGKGGKYRHAVDNMSDLYVGMQGMAALNRLPSRAMGLDTIRSVPGFPPQEKGLHLVFEKDRNTGRLGWYSPKDHSIHTPGRSNSFAHEWMHGVDYMVLDSFNNSLVDDMGKAFRGYSGKIRRQGIDWAPGSVQEAWINLMNTLFFDKSLMAGKIMELEKQLETTKGVKTKAKIQQQLDKIKRGNYQGRAYPSPFVRQAKQIPKNTDSGYWTRPAELVARAFESYMAKKFQEAGLPTDIMTMGQKAYKEDGPFHLLYPKGGDRDRIFGALDDLMDAMIKSDMFGTGDTDAASIPLDARTDPLKTLREMDMRHAPEGIKGMLINDAKFIKQNISRVFKDRGETIKEDLGPMEPQEMKLLKKAIRNPDKVVRPPMMEDERFDQIKRAAKQIADLKERPMDTQTWRTKSNTARMVAFTSEKSMLHVLEKRNPRTDQLSKAITGSVASPGVRRDSVNTYIGHKRETMHKYGNRLAAVVQKYKLGKEILPWKRKNETKALRYAYFNPDAKKAPASFNVSPERFKQLQGAASEINTMNRQLSYELEKAGIDIGEVSDDIYLRRIYDRTKIWADRKGFLEQARKTYLAKYAKDIGNEDNANIPKFLDLAGENGFRSDKRFRDLNREFKDNPDEIRGPIDEEFMDEVFNAGSRKDAQDWLNNLFSSPEYQNVGAPSGFMKGRELPAEADVLLEDYMVSDPVESMISLITGVADQTAWRTNVEREEGSLRKAEIKAINDGWDYEDAQMAVEMIRNIGGRTQRSQGIISRGVAATVNAVHLGATALLMARSVFASGHEVTTFALRTGEFKGTMKAWGNLMKNIANTSDSRENRRIFQAYGLIENKLMAQMMSERTGGLYEESPRMQRFANRYFENMLLSPLTRKQRESVMTTTPIFLMTLAQDYKGEAGGFKLRNKELRKEAAIDEFTEMGVPTGRMKEFVDYVLDMNGELPDLDEAFDPGELSEMYMRAIGHVADHVIQNPSVMDAPRLANNPTGRFVYGLMRFSFAFWDNITKRAVTDIGKEYKRGGVGPAAQLALTRYLPAYGLLLLNATAVFSLRTLLFNHAKWEEKDDDDELLQYLFLGGLAYSSPWGPIGDILLNMVTAVKYQKDLANFFVGAQASVPLQIFQSFLTAAVNNSPNTDTQERNATEAAYRLLVSLPSSLAVGTFPGGSVLGTSYGIANMFIASKGSENAVSEAIYGPKEPKGSSGGRGRRKGRKGRKGRSGR